MEDIEDLFLISNFRTKIYGTFELSFWILIFNWYSNFKIIIQLWNDVYFAMKPAELVLVFCLQIWILILEALTCLFISLFLILYTYYTISCAMNFSVINL